MPKLGPIALRLLLRIALILTVTLAMLAPITLLLAASEASLAPDGSFEVDGDADQWPDGWANVEPGGSWREENGDHFLRLSSTEPGAMVMLYQEIPIPTDVAALEIPWKQRVTGLKTGKQEWFDARILMEFTNTAREKVGPNPGAPGSRKATEGWEQKSTSFLVPDGATPC